MVEEEVEEEEEEEETEEEQEEKTEEEEKSSRLIHWPVLLFLAGLTKFASIPCELIMPWTSLSGDKEIKFHPSLCHLLFEARSPQLVSSVFSRRRVQPDLGEMNTILDWFATGYCIAHSDNTSSWNVEFDQHSPRCLQMLATGLHYSSTIKSGSIGSLNKVTLNVSDLSSYLEIFPSLYPYTQTITSLVLNTDLHPSDEGVPLLRRLSHYCPKLENLFLPRLYPPYLSAKLKFPQRTLVSLHLTLPLMSDDTAVGNLLQQCKALKQISLYGADE